MNHTDGIDVDAKPSGKGRVPDDWQALLS